MSSISGEDAFVLWAPEGAPWSDWAKPVLFIQPGGQLPAHEILDKALPPIPWALDPDGAVIINLPGAESVLAGLSLAQRGYQPVPLFNGTSGIKAAIDVTPIATALGGGAARLRHCTFAPGARPAFLIDSRRQSPSTAIKSGVYDNRWIVLPQDFPSGALLVNRGIRSATLLQHGSLTIPADLAHVLRRWRDQGMRIDVIDWASGQRATDVAVSRPPYFRLAWYAALAIIGLHRSHVGGFGSTIPQSGGGFYG